LGSGGRISHDVAKKVRLLNLEKDELTHSLNETESALEVEESKVLRLQTEVSQIRQEIDRRIQEKGRYFHLLVQNNNLFLEEDFEVRTH
jgi:hypothetical protein